MPHKLLTTLALVLPFSVGVYAQGVGINTDGSAPDANTVLDVKSTGSTSSQYGLKVKNSGGTDQFVVRSDGKVGIGTNNPGSYELNLQGNQYISGGVLFDCPGCGSTSTLFGSSSWGDMTIQGRVMSANSNIHLSPPSGYKVVINGTYRAAGGATGTDVGLQVSGETWLCSSTGNTGVGTTSPSHKVHVDNTTSDNVLRLEGPDTYGSGARLNFGDGDYVYLDEDSDDDLTIYAADRIALQGGDVGVHTTAPAYDLDVNGDIRARNNFYVDNERRIYPTPGGSYARLGSGGNAFQDLYSRYTYFSTTYTVSDSTYKKDITPLPNRINALDVVKSVQPKAFKWRLNKLYWEGAEPVCDADTSWRYGFIAQDIAQYMPETVQTDEETGRVMMNYEAVVSVLFQAVKEQQKEIEELRKEIDQISEKK